MAQTTDENVYDYLRLSKDDLETADILLREGKYRACLSRCYYAVFYAVSALLLSRGIVRRKHSGIEAAFHQFFVKPGLVEPDYGKTYGDIREARELSDYELVFVPVEELTQSRVDEAKQFVAYIEKLLIKERPSGSE